jgi:hypothetical protein
MNKEMGGKDSHTVTALPGLGNGTISVTRGVKLEYDHNSVARSDTSSQNNLVHEGNDRV